MADTHKIRATAPPDILRDLSDQWSGEVLGTLLDNARTQAADAPALLDGVYRLTYRQLGERVDQLTAGLAQLGVGAGSIVLAQIPNWWEMSVLAHALWGCGAIFNPVVPIYREHELSYIICEAKPSAVVIPHRHRGFDFVEMLQRLRERDVLSNDVPIIVVRREGGELPAGFVDWETVAGAPVATRTPAKPDDIALLLYTSGTTGKPKGVLHTHGTLLYETDSIIQLARLDATDRVFMPSPLAHITGLLYGIILPARLQIPCILLDRWEPAVAVELVEREGCTFTVAASPFLHGMTAVHEASGRPSSLRVFICGGADVPPDLVRRGRASMGARIVRAYGSTELPTLSCGDPYGDVEQAATTDGLPIGTAQARLQAADGGPAELLVRGPELFVGYLDPAANAGAFTPDGFFRTGDTASLGPDDTVTIRGRIKDLIIRGGENLSAKEIEDLLVEHPSVDEVAVVGRPDPILGERPWAFVVAHNGARFELGDAQEHLRRRGLAKQKWPEGIEIVRSLPKTASGKVKKFELRQQLQEP